VSTAPRLDPPVAVRRAPADRALPAHASGPHDRARLRQRPVAGRAGTVGTLWAWLAYALLRPHADAFQWGVVIGVSALSAGGPAPRPRATRARRPGAVVWDEVVGFWLVLWLVTPAGFWAQAVAFVLFRIFDAAKPGPVAWADALYKIRRGQPIGWPQGFAIMLDDLVAALCTLLVIALWRAW
jgi:phosphatidylglycerophosphatase A